MSLRWMLLAARLTSIVFYGPPGTGKTALAHVIANHTKSRFKPLNAVAAGTKEVREIIAEARAHLEDAGERTILFLDEIHRFNKAQQDVLLPDVEEGVIILIGATTQNPFFAINSPLLSRSQIFTFEPLTREQIKTLVRRALADKERGLGDIPIHLHDDALEFLAEMSDGEDPRFIPLRCVTFAPADVRNPALRALLVAVAAAYAVEFVGLPECQLNLSQAVTYLARAPKSNASTIAIGSARSDVQKGRTVPVPKHLKDTHYRGAKETFGHGVGYQYAHDFEGGWVDQEYLGVDRTYYEPTDRGEEAEIKARLEELRRKRDQ